MKRSNLLATAAMALVFCLGFATRAYTFEPHPDMRAAMGALKNAMHHLETSKHDFGGHRVRAMEHVRAAIAEVQASFAFDR